jgi:precorrin-6B C5,15-methyltransferase / cobalt-precorrin-6B C5,C15-methyltransferase
VLYGGAPDALASLPRPNAVFVGGGGTGETLERSWSALRPGGRMVVHAVTQETESILIDGWRRHGGELSRLSVEHLEPIGRYHGWRPARAVVQWSSIKGLE